MVNPRANTYVCVCVFSPTVSIHINCVVRQQMFSRCFAETPVFSNLNATRPDNTIIDENNRNVFILEVRCCFDSCLQEVYLTKLVKYHPLVQQISGLGYKCQYLVLIFGSLGHVRRLVIRALRIVGFSKARAKQLAKYCSISSIIGSRQHFAEKVLCVSIICCLNCHQTHIAGSYLSNVLYL